MPADLAGNRGIDESEHVSAGSLAADCREAGQQKAYAAERAISLVRVTVIAVNIVCFPFVRQRPGVIPPLAFAIIGIAAAYGLVIVIFRPFERAPALKVSVVLTVGDALLIAAWLVATGGLESPYYALWFPSLAAAMFRFDLGRTLLTAVGYAALYFGIALGLNQLQGHVADVVIRLSYIVLTGLIGGFLAQELLARIRSSIELEERLRAETELKQALRFQALHDGMTGLPNRTLLADRLDQAIKVADREHGSFTLLYMDINGFKEVNDTLGHDCGDALLVAVAQRLKDGLRRVDTVARVGGDEFVALLPGVTARDAKGTVRRLLASASQPYELQDTSVSVGLSVGIASYPAQGRDAWTLMRRADQDMYEAKRTRPGLHAAGRRGAPVANGDG